jgi:hypothetical protein
VPVQSQRNKITAEFYATRVESLLIVMNSKVLSFDLSQAGGAKGIQTLHDLVNGAPKSKNILMRDSRQDISTQFAPSVVSSNYWSLMDPLEEPHVCQAVSFNTDGDARYDSTAMRIGATLATRDKKHLEGDDDNMYEESRILCCLFVYDCNYCCLFIYDCNYCCLFEYNCNYCCLFVLLLRLNRCAFAFSVGILQGTRWHAKQRAWMQERQGVRRRS